MRGRSYYAVLQYDGGRFAGWQRQPDTRTVQSDFEAALARLAGGPVGCTAAGRTDAGVHALGQVVSFQLDRAWDGGDLTRALRALTPDDMWIVRAGVAPTGFHARRDARSRQYRYVIGCDPAAASPFRRPFEWALGTALSAPDLAAAARLVSGEHDFRAFATVGQPKHHYRCNVTAAAWAPRPDGEGYIFTIEADRFLHRMVRFLVGTMVDVARGRRPLDDVFRLLRSTDNREASPPAPPQGLFLTHVRLIDGVTTNPTLMAKHAGATDPTDVLKEICATVDGHVSAEVVAVDARGMYEEGRQLAHMRVRQHGHLPARGKHGAGRPG